MVSVLHLLCTTRNKSISSTTLHTLMNVHVGCMMRGIHVEIHFVPDLSTLPKIIKTGERILFMDYGTNLNNEILEKIFEPMEKYNVLVFPSVKEGINWEHFVKKTKEGSKEGAHQRGLEFDTEVARKLGPGLYECDKTSARVWLMDAKVVDKKLRGGKEQHKLHIADVSLMFAQLKQLGVKIAVASEAMVICHYVHECLGNILEAAGVQLRP
jgi:hypothetical protein